ncbi:YkvA family protein [Arvimicrobium flavum]|uniref:YkvA family protein n=1 Tax=Arvimicrobium flavum TaxID=3393320 RepID=UPI00237AA398|nr:YkvA family protein [Mesorhizobium shangrilense]
MKKTDESGRETFVRENFWRTAKRAARHVPFMQEVVAAYYCAFDRETPLKAKGIILAALAYFVLPADTVPDFIFGLGFTDDVAVLTAAISAIAAHMKPAHRAAARAALADES